MDRNLKPRPGGGGRGGNSGGGGVIARAAPQSREDFAKTELHLDGLVVLKIVKHAHENPVTRGILLGLDQADHLEVTNCFPLLPDGSERQVDRYTQDMLKLLREVKIDNFNIGWYQSSPLNAFCTETFVQIHHMYQEETAGAAAIIYDPISASLGSLFLKVCVELLLGFTGACMPASFNPHCRAQLPAVHSEVALGDDYIQILRDCAGRENPRTLHTSTVQTVGVCFHDFANVTTRTEPRPLFSCLPLLVPSS
jgi:hypothetical protein